MYVFLGYPFDQIGQFISYVLIDSIEVAHLCIRIRNQLRNTLSCLAHGLPVDLLEQRTDLDIFFNSNLYLESTLYGFEKLSLTLDKFGVEFLAEPS